MPRGGAQKLQVATDVVFRLWGIKTCADGSAVTGARVSGFRGCIPDLNELREIPELQFKPEPPTPVTIRRYVPRITPLSRSANPVSSALSIGDLPQRTEVSTGVIEETTDHNQPHVALYGNIKLIRAWCGGCNAFSFVSDRKLRCCGVEYIKPEPELVKRMSEPEDRRRLPGINNRKEILQAQDYRCFYCQRIFGSKVFRRGRMMLLKLQWDHAVPYSWSQNNHVSNFVAACHVCNSCKRAIMFQTVEDACIYLARCWNED